MGSTVTQACNVRFLSATNRDLPDLIANGTFREDLYYRLQVVEICLPPLRSRGDDIPLLVDHFCVAYAQKNADACFEPDAFSALMAYHWPGNIRELQNEVQRCLALADGLIGMTDLSSKLQKRSRGKSMVLAEASRGSLREIMDGFEREVLLASLARTQWNVKRTATELGLSRAALYSRLRRFGITRETFGTSEGVGLPDR